MSVVAVICALAVPVVPLLGGLACIAIMIAGFLVSRVERLGVVDGAHPGLGLGALALLLLGVDGRGTPGDRLGG